MKQARSETHYLWKIISVTHQIIGDIVTKVVIEVITYNTQAKMFQNEHGL